MKIYVILTSYHDAENERHSNEIWNTVCYVTLKSAQIEQLKLEKTYKGDYQHRTFKIKELTTNL